MRNTSTAKSKVLLCLCWILYYAEIKREREREREMESDDTNETTRHSSSGLVGVVSEGVSVIFSSFISFSTLFSRTFLS